MNKKITIPSLLLLVGIYCVANSIQYDTNIHANPLGDSQMTQESYFQDLYIKTYRPAKPAKQGFIFFHGFPGGGVRNEDLAEAISAQTPNNCFVVHYGGLGNGKGKFSFKRSIEQSVQFVEAIIQKEQFESVSLYGHSWGGLVALNVATKLQSKLNKLVLVSPYSMVPPASMVPEILSVYIEQDPKLEMVLSTDEAVEDVKYIEKYYNPRNIIKQIEFQPKETLFLQAKDDNEVPVSLSRSFLPLFSKAPDYREVAQNHSFNNRGELIRTILDWLN